MMKFTNRSQATKQTGLSYLGNTEISQKIVKSQKVNKTMTYCMYLAPAKVSGYNVCSHATPECKIGCLATSGRAKMELRAGKNAILNARIKKARLLFEHQEFFMDWLIAEIKAYENKAIAKGMKFAVRLNGTSDIDWQRLIHRGKNIFDHFSHLPFYDYTKNITKFIDKPKNYHLTYSYTGRNWNECVNLLETGENIAMVFNMSEKESFPTSFAGYKVVNGDLTDLRTKDDKGIIVGLKWKHIADKQANETVRNSVFCIQKTDVRINSKDIKMHATVL